MLVVWPFVGTRKQWKMGYFVLATHHLPFFPWVLSTRTLFVLERVSWDVPPQRHVTLDLRCSLWHVSPFTKRYQIVYRLDIIAICVYLHISTAYMTKRQSYSTSTAWNKECVPCCAGLYWICIYPLFPSKNPWVPALPHSLPRPYKWSWRLSTSFTPWHLQSTNHGHFWEKLVTCGPSFLEETWHFGRGTVKFQWSYNNQPKLSFKGEILQIIFWNQVWIPTPQNGSHLMTPWEILPNEVAKKCHIIFSRFFKGCIIESPQFVDAYKK